MLKSVYLCTLLFCGDKKLHLSKLVNDVISTACLQVILASGYFAVFRVKLTAKNLEGIHDGAIQITTDYEVRT